MNNGRNTGSQERPDLGEEGSELSEKARELYQQLGKKVYKLKDVKLDEESIAKETNYLAMEAVENDAARRKELRREKHSKWAKVTESWIARAVMALPPVSIAVAIKRTADINKYKTVAEQAIRDTNKMSAGRLAVEQRRKTKSYNEDLLTDEDREDGVPKSNADIVSKVSETLRTTESSLDSAIEDRVEEAINAGENNVDLGVKISENENEEQIRDALAEYAKKVASLKGETQADERTKSRQDLEEQFKKLGKDFSKYQDTVDDMADDLRHKLFNELNADEESQEHEAALEAIDEYVRKHVDVLDVQVDSGLAATDKKGTLADRVTMKYGVGVGLAVGVGATCLGFMKNSVIGTLAGSGIVGMTCKAALAGTIGAAHGRAAKKAEQINKNIKNALNVDSAEIKEGKEYSIISVDKKIAEMQAIEYVDGKFIRKNEDGSEDEVEGAEVNDLIAELRSKNEIQNKKGIQLLGYNGRENVEKTKLNMFRQINRLQKGLAEVYGDSFDETMNNKIVQMTEQFSKDISAVDKVQKAERRHAAVVTGFTAFTTAAISSFVIDYTLGAIKSGKLLDADNSKLLHEINGLSNGELKWNGLRVVEVGTAAGVAIEANDNDVAVDVAKDHEITKEYKGALLISDDDEGGVAIGFDANGDGELGVDELLHGAGSEKGLDLTNDEVYNDLADELKEYGIELKREQVLSSTYGEVNIGDYIEKQSNAVEVNGVDWAKSATKVAFGRPVAVAADGMDQYEVAIKGIGGGNIPDGAKFFVDLDGDGPGKALEFPIEDGKVILPADVVDTSSVGANGVAKFIGIARVGEVENGNMISYATAIGKKASLDSTIMASISGNDYAFTAINDSGERISQFAVDASGVKISNLSDIFNGIEVDGNDRLPMTFTVNEDVAPVELASGETFSDYNVSGGYHPEFDAFENKAFIDNKNYLGTPMIWDADGDGNMNSIEELSYIKQMLVRTGTNPFMLGQNASNYGILEPARLNQIIDADILRTWGIEDGVVDSETDLNILLEALKQPENAEYWDKLANETINEMEKQLQNGGFHQDVVTDRLSTYANSGEKFDTASAKTRRDVLYPYHIGEDGEEEAIGNTGWWCRKYGAEGGKVGDLPRCEQKSIIRQGSAGSEGSEGIEGTISEVEEGTDSEGIEGTDSEGAEGTDSEGAEGTDSEGIEGTDSEGIEGTDSEEIEGNTPKNPDAIRDNMGIGDESENEVTPRDITEPTEVPTFEQPVEVKGTSSETAAQEAADAAAKAVGETPIMSQDEKADSYFEQF